jgi:hypothetical protein
LLVFIIIIIILGVDAVTRFFLFLNRIKLSDYVMVSILFYFYKEISVGQGGPAEERGEGSTKRQHKIMNNLNFHCHHLPVAEGEEKKGFSVVGKKGTCH